MIILISRYQVPPGNRGEGVQGEYRGLRWVRDRGVQRLQSLRYMYKYKGTVHSYYYVQIQRYITYLLFFTNTKIQHILVVIYKYKDTVYTYYHLQIQRCITYLLLFTNTKIYYILIIFYKYKDTVYTYYRLQIQRYSSLLLLCKYSKVLYILLCTNTMVRTYLVSFINTKVQYILIIMYKYKGTVHIYYLVHIQMYITYL